MRAERQLKASLKEIRDLKAALDEHAIVAITNPQGKITYVNDKFCAISQYGRSELLGQDHRLINSGFHSKSFFQNLWDTITQGRVWKGEIKNRAKDGSFYWVDTTIVPFLAESGKPRQYVAIRADITERKITAERAVWLGSFPELNPNPIIELDVETGVIYYLNSGALKVFSNVQHQGLDHPGLAGLAEIARLIQKTNGKPVRREVNIGTEFYSQTITYVPESRRLRIYGNNITELKIAQKKIQSLNVELEARVRQRTADLESFSYSVSHDLRAPVRAMGGYASLILDEFPEALPVAVLPRLNRILEGSHKMEQLIDGLLTFSRLNQLSLSKTLVSPATIVQQVLEELQAEQTGRRIEFITGKLPACQADPTLLRQVFTNLLSNAIKYTRHRDPAQVEIGWIQTERAYFIKDNGAGFDMQYAGRLFGVFERLHRADQFEGTGVGLAIVHRIVQRHGGKIWAEAAPECGATFLFSLAEQK